MLVSACSRKQRAARTDWAIGEMCQHMVVRTCAEDGGGVQSTVLDAMPMQRFRRPRQPLSGAPSCIARKFFLSCSGNALLRDFGGGRAVVVVVVVVVAVVGRRQWAITGYVTLAHRRRWCCSDRD